MKQQTMRPRGRPTSELPGNAPWPEGQAYPPPPRSGRRKQRVAWEATLALLAVAVILASVATLLIVELWMLDRILPGVYVWNIDIGGMTRGEAIEQLGADFEYPLDRYLTLRHGDQTWVVEPEDMGARLDTDATVDAALEVGHHGNLLTRFREQFEVLLDGHLIAPVLAFDQNAGVVFLSSIASQLDRPMRNATLSLNDDLSVNVVPGQAGRKVDIEATRQILVQRMAEMRGGEVELVMQNSEPLLADVSAAQAQVQQILSGPVVLTGPDSFSYTLEPATLASWLILRPVTGEDGQATLTVSLDPGHLRNLAEELAVQIERPPTDAQFRWDYTTGSLGVALPSVPGHTLDVTRTVSLVAGAAVSGERVVSLPVLEVRPDLASEDGPSLGIVELIAEGVTSFAGSSASRVQNIIVGAQQFDGLLIPPGETFSFNHYLGEVTAEKGYEEGIIIWGNETRADVGGGLCQVSSTAFRAAFWAGVPITERWAHAFRVSYYEPPKGLDATIYSPSVDLKWVNDTGHYILIHTYVDRANQTLTFHYFGTKPNHTVEIDGPYEANPVPHGPPVYRDDPTLPQGETRQIEWPKDGLDVTVYRIIKENGAEIRRDTFFSRYQPWQAIYLVGTKEE